MKKILALSLGFILLGSSVAFAQAENTLGTPEPISVAVLATNADPITTSYQPASSNLQCVQGAVKTREAAVASALSTFFVSATTSLATRASALDTAWGLADGKARRSARNAAWSAYQKSTQNARKIFRTSKKTAWDAFKTTSLNTCKTAVVESEENDNLPL